METEPIDQKNELTLSSDQREFDVLELNPKHLEELKEIRMEGPDSVIRQRSSQNRVEMKQLYDSNSILELIKMFYDELIIDNFKFSKPIDFLKVLKFLKSAELHQREVKMIKCMYQDLAREFKFFQNLMLR